MQLLTKIGCWGLRLVAFTFDRYWWLLCPVWACACLSLPPQSHQAPSHHPASSLESLGKWQVVNWCHKLPANTTSLNTLLRPWLSMQGWKSLLPALSAAVPDPSFLTCLWARTSREQHQFLEIFLSPPPRTALPGQGWNLRCKLMRES